MDCLLRRRRQLWYPPLGYQRTTIIHFSRLPRLDTHHERRTSHLENLPERNKPVSLHPIYISPSTMLHRMHHLQPPQLILCTKHRQKRLHSFRWLAVPSHLPKRMEFRLHQQPPHRSLNPHRSKGCSTTTTTATNIYKWH